MSNGSGRHSAPPTPKAGLLADMQNILIDAAGYSLSGIADCSLRGAPNGCGSGIPLPKAWAAGPDRSRSQRFRARTAQNPAARTRSGSR
jgi:hypothetical protein